MTDALELYREASQQGIAVDDFPLTSRDALSIMDNDGDCFIALDSHKVRSLRDETVKLAHELGHCVTGSFYNRYAACDVRQKHENRADKWAIERLIPREELNRAVSHGHTELWDLADYFNVPEDFMRKAVCWYEHGNLDVDSYF